MSNDADSEIAPRVWKWHQCLYELPAARHAELEATRSMVRNNSKTALQAFPYFQ